MRTWPPRDVANVKPGIGVILHDGREVPHD
jgi:hypothetical protein